MASTEHVAAPARDAPATRVRSWRRLRTPAAVSLARLRARPGRNALLLGGIATSVALLVVVFGAVVVARDLSLRRTVAALPVDQRSFRIDFIGLPSEATPAHLDAAASGALARLGADAPLRIVSFRDFWLDGEFIRLAGIDDTRGSVQLLSGRLPRRCDARVCEVLQIGGGTRERLGNADIHLVRVGTGAIVEPARFGTTFTQVRRQRAQGSFPRTTILLGPSADAVERLAALQYLLRLRSWIAPVDAHRLHAWQIAGLLGRESQAQTILERADPSFTLTGPDSALLDARDRGETYARRMLLVGAGVAVLLFGFAILAASGLRRGLRAERRRLAERGATRTQLVVAAGTEVGAIVAVGWLLGLAAGAVAVAAVARANGLPAGATLRHSLGTSGAALVLVAALVVGVALVAWTATSAESQSGSRRIRPLDFAALGAVLAVAVGMSRGALSVDASSSGRSTTFLLLLPVLVALAGGLLGARLLAPLAAAAERGVRSGSIATRLALLALTRAPGRTAACGAFVVVTAGLVVFAAAYSSTLARGAHDEAAYAVPLDVTLSEGPRLVLPLDAAPLGAYEHLAPGVGAYPVVRTTADAAGPGTSLQSATVLGVPSEALARMHWRSDYSATSRPRLAGALAPSGPSPLAAVPLPPGVRTARVRTHLRGTPLTLDLVFRDARGHTLRSTLGVAHPGSSSFAAPIPLAVRQLLGVELALTPAASAWLFHLAHEERLVKAPHGVISLDSLAVGNRPVDVSRWVVRAPQTTLRGTRIAYSFTDVRTLVFRPRQATDGAPIPVLASPAIAAAAGPGGLLTLNFYDPRLRARVVATARRFPTIPAGDDFVVADESALATALEADAPGTGTAGELWLSVPQGADATVRSALARPPFSRLARVSRRQLASQAEHDPLARGVESMLGIAALLALALAVIGLWATTASDVRDERDALFDLEAQGVGPRMLRRQLRLRSLFLLGFGLAGGAVLGFVLSRLVVSLVQVTAAATAPDPPLVLDLGLGSLAVAAAVLCAATLLVVEATTRRAFRHDVPERGSWSGE